MSQPYDQLFKLLIIGDSGKAQSDVLMTNMSPGPPWWVFWPVRPHKVSDDIEKVAMPTEIRGPNFRQLPMPTKLRSFIFAVNLFLVFRAHKRPSFFLHTPHKNPLLIIKIDEILPAIILIIFFSLAYATATDPNPC